MDYYSIFKYSYYGLSNFYLDDKLRYSTLSGRRHKCYAIPENDLSRDHLESKESISAARHLKIVGGHNAEIKEFPYFVSIRYGEHYCSGSIISDRHILTAAHCMDYVNQDEVTIHSGTSRTNEEGTVHKILSIHNHPKFDITNGEDGHPAHNIAVLTLEKPIVFNKHQQKIKLPSHDVQNNQVVYMVGWGRMSKWDHSRSRQLQKLRVNLLSSEKCVPLTSHEITPDQLCPFSTTRQACQGDSGGPLGSCGRSFICGYR